MAQASAIFTFTFSCVLSAQVVFQFLVMPVGELLRLLAGALL